MIDEEAEDPNDRLDGPGVERFFDYLSYQFGVQLRACVEIHVNRQRWGGTINWPEPESVRFPDGVP